MTTATAELCGHRWPTGQHASICSALEYHRCELPASHRGAPGPIPRPCRCDCGATTTARKETTR